MRDSISRTALLDVLKMHYSAAIATDYKMGIGMALLKIKEAPAVDAVEVVQCKDCRYFDTTGYPPNRYGIDGLNIGHCQIWDKTSQKLGYCCHGERRDDNA